MPLLKRVISDPYSLASENIYAQSTNEEMLQACSHAEMTGVLRQLNQLSTHASSIFTELFEIASKTNDRLYAVTEKTVHLIEQIVPVEKTFEDAALDTESFETSGASKFERTVEGGDIASRFPFDKDHQPMPIQELRMTCDPAPPLNTLDEFAKKNEDGTQPHCLKKYSNPDFFYETWLEEELKRNEKQRKEKEERKKKRKDLKAKKRAQKAKQQGSKENKEIQSWKDRYAHDGAPGGGHGKTKSQDSGAPSSGQPPPPPLPPSDFNDSEFSYANPAMGTDIGGPPPPPPPRPQSMAVRAAPPLPMSNPLMAAPPPVPITDAAAPMPPPLPTGEPMIANLSPAPPLPAPMGGAGFPPPLPPAAMAGGGAPPPLPPVFAPPVPGGGAPGFAPPVPTSLPRAEFAPPAPPAAPLPSFMQQAPAPPGGGGGGGLMAQLQAGKTLKKLTTADLAPKKVDTRGGIMDEIKRKKALRHVDKTQEKAAAPPPKEVNKTAASIAAIMDRRKAVQGDSDDDDDSDSDGDW